MTTSQQERVTAGARWDTVANDYYLNPTGYAQLLSDNFFITNRPVIFDGGELLIIADIEAASGVETENLPPWKK